MRVSVVIPAYNAEAYVAEAIESVLRQSRPPDQVIAVDDGSTDGTRSVLDRYSSHIICLSQVNRGQTETLNRGIALADGDVLCFQDADDVWCEKKLEHQIAALASEKQIDAVFGLVRQFVSSDVSETRRAALHPANEIVRGARITLMIRRAAFDKIGSFDETFRITSMVEWLARAKLKGLRSVMLDEVVALRRLHLTNGGRTQKDTQDKETLLALKRVIDVRRQSR
jgi:glycosyltransferase involved in cell wall biosynthesis